MKKLISSRARNLLYYSLTLLMGLVLSSSSCNPQDAPDPDGVKINGVVWAKYNVESPGYFAPNPGSPGMFYQWNRKVGWPATGVVIGWNTTYPPAAWNPDNDPCPDGWRVPTQLELERLCDGTKVLFTKQTQNGNDGMLFTDIASNNSIFLPAAGERDETNGNLSFVNQVGYYWSNTAMPDNGAIMLDVSMSTTVYIAQVHTRYGLSIRCVKK